MIIIHLMIKKKEKKNEGRKKENKKMYCKYLIFLFIKILFSFILIFNFYNFYFMIIFKFIYLSHISYIYVNCFSL